MTEQIKNILDNFSTGEKSTHVSIDNGKILIEFKSPLFLFLLVPSIFIIIFLLFETNIYGNLAYSLFSITLIYQVLIVPIKTEKHVLLDIERKVLKIKNISSFRFIFVFFKQHNYSKTEHVIDILDIKKVGVKEIFFRSINFVYKARLFMDLENGKRYWLGTFQNLTYCNVIASILESVVKDREIKVKL